MEQITGFRTSPRQRQLWQRQRADGARAYGAQASLALDGDIRAERLRRALEEVVGRHEILRTSFQRPAGAREPLQVIEEEARPHWETVDLRGESPQAQAEAFERLWEAERTRERTPAEHGAVRATLALLGESRARLLLSLPALCADAVTLRNLASEIGRAYSADGAAPGLDDAEEPLQYADLAQWENELFDSPDAELGKDYWRGRHDEGWFASWLPSQRQAAGADAFDPRVLTLDLDPRLWGRLRSLPLYQSSPAAFLLSCWQVLLWRLGSCPEEVFVAVGQEGRAYEELKDALGLFTKSVPVGARLTPDEPLRKAVERAAQPLREAERWQEYFSWEYLGAGDDAPPHFLPYGFDYEERTAAGWATPSAAFRLERLWVCAERYAVKLNCVLTGESLTTEWHYDGAAHDEEEVRRLALRYQKLLEGAVERPETPVGELAVLCDDERRRLLAEWNDTRRDYALDRCLHELYEEQAARTPDALALIAGARVLSYAELDERAEDLARRLSALGVGPDVPVGVLMERSAELLVALLGVLKAGGAYVPLDPSYPAERLRYMLDDSGARVLLTQSGLAGGAAEFDGTVVALDDDGRAAGVEHGAGEAVRRAAPGNLAYVIYTSGSTGRPKGVMISHRAVVNFLGAMQELFALSARDRLLSVTSLSFDIAGLELYLPLAEGAAVVLAPREATVDPLALRGLLAGSGATVMQATPSTWRMLLDGGWEGDPRLRALCGGEALPRELASQLAGRCGELWNMYGPTETTIWSLSRKMELGHGRVTIGSPVANTQVYVLDERTQLVPVGVAGELYIGGEGVARGYLNRPGLTAERFVPDPFSGEPGARLYRTGDLVRYLPGGEVDFLGRIDQQVKVRGHRIELGEIEAVLEGHAAVRQCVVTAREDVPGEKQIVAYVVSADGQPASEGELRQHLALRLPEYMIPARVVLLAELPLTPNGKVDRKALPTPAQAHARAGDAGREQYSILEEMLADIWSHVLNVERVGLHDSFFELGGHSLLGVQLISRLREVFEVELTLDDVFEARTLVEMARRVEGMVKEQQGVKRSPIRRAAREGGVALSFAQQRLWFLERLNPGSAVYNLGYATRLTGRLDVDALRRTFAELTRRHESLRTTFPVVDELPVQVIAPAAEVELPLTDLSHLPEQAREAEARRLASEEARKTFDLERGPLMRAQLLKLSDEEHVLVLTLHHIIWDAWSLAVLVEEMAALYEAYAGGRPSPLPEPEIQYADYAAWQREWLRGEALAAQLEYWRGQLAGAPPVLELPADNQRPATQGFSSASHHLRLPPELAAGLKSLGRGEGVTLFMTLLAGFSALLSRYAGQEDVVVGAPIAGRTRAETERLIGFFVNTLALRVRLDGDPSFRELVGRVREVTLGAYAHQDIPFEKLVEELQPVRDLRHTPLFQVAFVWNNIPHEGSSVSGLGMSSIHVNSHAAKFDLTLAMSESRDGWLNGDIEYRADLFEAATVERMAAHFRNLLEAAVAAPDASLSDLPMLAESEQRRQLYEWNETAAAYPRDLLLHELFERQAERTPEAVAVSSGGERLSYAELNRRADGLAARLRGLGVGPDVPVGVLMERSAELVVALLGVLKAGGAYVPLDPEYPAERLAYMLEDSGARVLLAQEHLRGRVPEYAGHVVGLGADGEADGRVEEGAAQAAAVAADNLAYVIYTSGSTGRPKGAMNTHGAIVNRLLWMQDAYRLDATDAVLQKTPYSFDVSVWEFFWPLLAGARLVMARPGGHRDPAYLRRLIAEERVTTLHFVPSMLQAFLAEPDLSGCESLRRVICSGEALPFELQERFFSRLGAELHNLYGPTEAAVDVTFWACERGGGGRRGVPIGRPVANTQVYVLDRRMRPVAVNVAGELYIGGVQLARGYLNRPGLTAERFVPDPFSAEPGARLYRTGDLARHRPDGAVEFVGRVDFQVKLRGFRVELGEIEAVLGEHPAVGEAAVVARAEGAGETRLIAYVVARGPEAPDADELRGYVQRRLPEYMTPAAFVALDALPLTASGKLDRRALPAPERQRAAKTYTAPRTPVEEKLCAIWVDLLHAERVGVDDNFFELGGHSLLATQLVSRIRQSFDVELPLQTVFESPTVAGLTKVITAERAAREDSSEVARMLEQLKQLSPDDVRQMLNAEGQ